MSSVVDGVNVTYYPQDSNFQVYDPSIVFDDLSTLTSALPGKPIYLQELGYQSSTASGSSEQKQAEFYCNFFKAWDQQVAKISHASILRLVDVSRASAELTAVDYGIPGNESFIEYIRTLGLVTWFGEGRDKTAVSVIRDEITERGW